MVVQKIKAALKRFSCVPKTNHKPYFVIVRELIYWILSGMDSFNNYFDYELYLIGKKPGEYIQRRPFLKLYHKINSSKYYSILEDKYFFHQIVRENGFIIPNTIYLIENSSILNCTTKKYVPIEAFLENDLDGFCKVIDGWGGRMIYLVEISKKQLKVNSKEISVPDFFKLLGKEKFIIQERIVQHKEMTRLNPSCINTLRIVTFKTGQTVELYQVFQRIGINGNYVDNGLHGNIIAGVQKDTGKLVGYAIKPDIKDFKIYHHPQTNIVLKDFNIPF